MPHNLNFNNFKTSTSTKSGGKKGFLKRHNKDGFLNFPKSSLNKAPIMGVTPKHSSTAGQKRPKTTGGPMSQSAIGINQRPDSFKGFYEPAQTDQNLNFSSTGDFKNGVNMEDLDEVLIDQDNSYMAQPGNTIKGLSPIALNSSMTNMQSHIQSR